MAMGRVTGLLDRQGHVVDLVVAGLVTLRIRAVIWGEFAIDRASLFGRQGRAGLRGLGIKDGW